MRKQLLPRLALYVMFGRELAAAQDWRLLRDALSLTPRQEFRVRALTPAQRVRLAGFEQVLYDGRTATEAIALGLLQAEEWVGVTLCPVTLWQVATRQRMSYAVVKDLEAAQRSGDIVREQNLVLGLLPDARRVELKSFSSRARVAALAVEAGLIARPPRGEVLCP
ncbi:MAG TPA: hypothetical protein VER03_16130 [Bryobacteraceae bacterium]|nr:hypothetical protein [Bryobacteraceae bacterium]